MPDKRMTAREFIITLSPRVPFCPDCEIESRFRSGSNMRPELRWFRWQVGNIRSHQSSTDSVDFEERMSTYQSSPSRRWLIPYAVSLQINLLSGSSFSSFQNLWQISFYILHSIFHSTVLGAVIFFLCYIELISNKYLAVIFITM